jgi:hypothetical protein
VATLGLTTGVLTDDLYSAVLVAVVLTTVVAPLLLNVVVPRAMAELEAGGRADAATPRTD